MIITLVQSDCLSWLKEQPDDSVSLILCSPPYENRRKYAEIDFCLTGQKWVDWCVERWIECNRVCKGLVAWVVDGKTEKFQWSATPALLMADLHRAGIKLRKPPIYHRVGIPGSGGPDWLRSDTEMIVCSSKGRLPWSDSTACGKVPKYSPGGAMSHRIKDGSRIGGGGPNVTKNGDLAESRPYTPPSKANPGSLLHFSVGGGKMGHPLASENEAPFPVGLASFFVKSFCPPDGIVADIFCGGSSTGQACVENGRNYVGVDCRESQLILSARRLGIHWPQKEKETA